METPEITELRADARYMSNTLKRLRFTLKSIADDMSDEGGRVYFGNTNQADDLKDLAQTVEDLSWGKVMRSQKQPDLYTDLRQLRLSQQILQDRIKELTAEASAIHDEREAFRDLINEALRLKGGWREAIVELEDHCSEPVRLRNMLAAADQLDEWATKSSAALSRAGG